MPSSPPRGPRCAVPSRSDAPRTDTRFRRASCCASARIAARTTARTSSARAASAMSHRDEGGCSSGGADGAMCRARRPRRTASRRIAPATDRARGRSPGDCCRASRCDADGQGRRSRCGVGAPCLLARPSTRGWQGFALLVARQRESSNLGWLRGGCVSPKGSGGAARGAGHAERDPGAAGREVLGPGTAAVGLRDAAHQ